MALPNNQALYTKVADIQWSQSYMVTANTTADLTGGTSYLLFTADATNGGFVQKLRLRATPAGNTSATVLRLWINNGSTTGTATNNILFDEISLPVVTASATAAVANYEIPLNFALPPGYRLYATIGASSANGWYGTVIGGKY
jgi:hypothetical protein